MTRFARAKGSKSSNEKAPEDSTPWEVMKEQLMQTKKAGEESKKREEAEKQRIDNYEKFLKDHKTQKRTATWCDFPETQTSITSNKISEPVKKKAKALTTKQHDSNNTQDVSSNTGPTKKKSKKKKLKPHAEIKSSGRNDNIPAAENVKEKYKHKNSHEIFIQKPEAPTSEALEDKKETSVNSSEKKKKKSKNKKAVSQEDHRTENNQHSRNLRQNERPTNQKPKQKNNKFVNGEPVRRKPIQDNSFQLIINGKEVELVRYDGFPIMKKDAERLAELKANMIKKGIPKSEVQRTMKLERRRAEKALARVKRDVCYNCRKGGHNLSDCPDLKTKIPNMGAPDGLCFKCGSTEHRQFECKVQRDKEFRFATCFICKEPGHIARQCPDNPKGLYPNGGSCKLCGDVTHLRKDCPTVQDKREDSSIKLQTLDSEELEGIPQTIKNTVQEGTAKKPKKIKF